MGSNNEMSNMTFRCVAHKDLTSLKSNIQMFNIIMALDGTRSLGTIARDDFYELDDLIEKVNQLLKMGIIEPVHNADAATNLDHSLVNFVKTELTALVGPLSEVLLKDAAANLGHDIANFPTGKVGELLDEVSAFIQDRHKAAEFKHSVMARLF